LAVVHQTIVWGGTFPTSKAKAKMAFKNKPVTAQIELISANRYNGGVRIKRQWGSSTVTEFWVRVNGVPQDYKVVGYGKTPGERKSYAKKVVEGRFIEEVMGS